MIAHGVGILRSVDIMKGGNKYIIYCMCLVGKIKLKFSICSHAMESTTGGYFFGERSLSTCFDKL